MIGGVVPKFWHDPFCFWVISTASGGDKMYEEWIATSGLWDVK